MPQWLSNLLAGDNRGPALAVVGLIVAVLIVFALYKFLVGNRLRLPGGGRARQPRLGVVDAFSLDGQRQLVLVRRDNVEHLVMIGGPTDVVVESQIVRVSAPVPAPPREREAAAPAMAAAPVLPTPPATPVAKATAPTARTEPAIVTPGEPRPGPQRAAPSPTSESIYEPKPKPAPPPVAPPSPFAPPPPAAKPSAPVSIAPPSVAATPFAAPPAPRPVAPRPPLPPPIVNATPRPRTTPLPPSLEASAPPSHPETLKREGPVGVAPPETIKPEAANAEAVKSEAAKPEDAFADLESLEAEMARLLGREP